MNLQTALYSLTGIGYTLSRRLENLGILTVYDLIHHYPFRYEDFANVSSALEASVGEKVTLVGEIWSIKNIYTRSRKILTQAIFNDGTSAIELTWFNQPYLTKSIGIGDRLQIAGKVSFYKNKYSIVAPKWEKVGNSEISLGSGESETLIPIYPETSGVTSKFLNKKVAQVLPRVKEFLTDPLPEMIRGEMLSLSEAIDKVHFPKSLKEAEEARERLGFDELFYIQLATIKTRNEWREKPLIEAFKIDRKKVDKFIKSLPFKLTGAQLRVIDEILEDLQRGQPMNRLVQGEVGSGKTAVAAVIAYVAHLNGLRSLYMAPTEILAFQHESTLSRLLGPLGITVGLYTGSKKFNKKTKSVHGDAGPARGQPQKAEFTRQASVNSLSGAPRPLSPALQVGSIPDIIVGTHALLSEKLVIDDIGLIIVDEQQRFGVGQRSFLRSRAKVPHFLTMTATPIPRTVALTLYGDLDLSIINEMPKGRKPVRTHVVPAKKRKDAYEFIRTKVKEGDQVYLITPLIELSETLTSAKAAMHEYEKLRKEIFPDLKIGLLHGRLKSKEKEQVLNEFKEHKLDILVSTSVVEVGVDVANATIMVIEGAERFGLAQLHQLRGRVGRGEKESFCFLFLGTEEEASVSRLKSLEKTNNGLELAELDLKIRGSGQLFGTQQSGRFELKIASFSDLTLIEKTREAAKKIVDEDPKLDKYPELRLKLQSFGSGVMPD